MAHTGADTVLIVGGEQLDSSVIMIIVVYVYMM